MSQFMTAQTENIDFYLIKTATVLTASIIANYILWSLNAPTSYKIIPVILMLATISFFLIKPPFLNYLPIKLFFIFIALVSMGSPTNAWDARSIWLFHAKRIFIENNLYAQLDGYGGFSHNDYPVLIPALSATLAKIVGYWNEVFPKFSSILAFIPAILLLSSVLKYRLQQLLLCNLLLFVLYKHFINGYMDGILAIYFTTASLLVYILTGPVGKNTFNSEQRAWLYFLAAFIFSALTMIKNEGLVLFIVLISATFLTRIIFQKTEIAAATVIIFLVSLVPIVIWKIICSKSDVSNDLTQSDLATHLMGRVFSIGDYLKIFAALILNLKFILPLILFIFVSRDPKCRIGIMLIAFSSLLYFCVLFAVYLSTSADLVWHLKTSASRTILPISLSLSFYVLLFSKIGGITITRKVDVPNGDGKNIKQVYP